MILYDIENLNPFELTQEYISHECRMMDKEDVYKWVYEDEKQIENYKKEIERLNNIINEYENMKKELLDYIYHNEYCRFGHIDGGEADEMRNILSRTDKLKELKESGNNE